MESVESFQQGLSLMQGTEGQELSQPQGETVQKETEEPKATEELTTQEPESNATEETQEEVDTSEEETQEEVEEEGIPEAYKEYENILKSRKWDPKDENFGLEVIKSYQNAEKEMQREKTLNHRYRQGTERLANSLGGDLESINEYRKSIGLTEIPAPQTAAQRKENKEFLFNTMNAALGGDEQAIAKLNDFFAKESEDIAKLSAKEETIKPVTRKDISRKANENYNKFLSENPEGAKYLDELSSYFSGGIFTSLGIDAHAFFSDEGRMAEAAKLGEALHVFNNLEDIVSKRVKAEVQRGNRGKAKGGKGGAPREQKSGGDEYMNYINHLATNVR